MAHLTIGLAPLAYLDTIEAGPVDGLTFQSSALAVFQLGNDGTRGNG